jgi:hypothetical protein
MGEKPAARPEFDGEVTHGICEKCRDAVLADFYAGRPDLLVAREGKHAE